LARRFASYCSAIAELLNAARIGRGRRYSGLSQVIARVVKACVDFQRLLEIGDGMFADSEHQEGDSAIVQRVSIARAESNGAAEFREGLARLVSFEEEPA
jgi:hypothetical protein